MSRAATHGEGGLPQRKYRPFVLTVLTPPHPTPQRNYRSFLLFVLTSTALCVWVFALCLLDVIHGVNERGWDWGAAQGSYIAAFVLMAYAFCLFW